LDAQDLRQEISDSAPELWKATSTIAEVCVCPIIHNLDRKLSSSSFPKTINDPIWGGIELYPWEIAILDSPLLQRLRGVSQLGLAHYIYPGASHSRLEHVLGVVEAADRMMRALERNAKNHQEFGVDKDPSVPLISELDRRSVRLAALLHDIGHGPFSHVTETLLRSCLLEDFVNAEKVLRSRFAGVTKIATSETIAVLIVLSPQMQRVFGHAHFEAVKESGKLAMTIAARILGSRSHLSAGYLSGVISGPVDADKIDYMARDSYHSGFPIGLDLNRLISKLEVITITRENAPREELKGRAHDGRVYEMGISLSGLGAYEQMIIGRVLLYDRLYYHHKVRAAEAMLRKLVDIVHEENPLALDLSSYFCLFSEGEYISAWSGTLTSDMVVSGGERALALGTALRSRHLYHRAFAFASRFVAGLDGLPAAERKETLQLQWDEVMSTLLNDAGLSTLSKDIHKLAIQLSSLIPELSGAVSIQPEHILVDFPLNKTVVRGNDILTRTEAGEVVPPNLYFDSEKWSQAYEHQKQVGHVFCPREYVPLVCLAAKILFYEKFRVLMGQAANNASKTNGIVSDGWIISAKDGGLCSIECAEALIDERPSLLRIAADDIELPTGWGSLDPGLTKRLAASFLDALPSGLPARARQSVLKSLADLLLFVHRVEQDGTFVTSTELPESVLQRELKRHLISRDVPVQEGTELGGGETDLILYGSVVVENKIRKRTSEPFESGADYAYQARRYSIALLQSVSFVIVAYQPSQEQSLLPLPARVQVSKIGAASEQHAQVRIVIPWGVGVPSAAKAPPLSRQAKKSEATK
jgi:HD superfamily phosphohydrolase